MNYVRYVVRDRKQKAWDAVGVITMANYAIKWKIATPEQSREIRHIFRWFNKNVPCPPFQKNLGKKWSKCDAVCWWRESASEPLKVTRRLVKIVREFWAVSVIRTSRPGRIVYRDEYQVVAETTKKRN